jgi:dolichol-phosphate mannosyltransferase
MSPDAGEAPRSGGRERPPPALLSVVLSFRNEEEVLPELISRLQRTLRGAGLAYELVFVNDASSDRSRAVLEEHRKLDERIRIVNMSRRFGVAPCVLAGMRYARGDALVYLDTDLQDPPELIPELVARFRAGAEVVHTVRTSRHGEPLGKTLATRAAYRLIGLVAEIPLGVEAGDFKLLSRRVVDHLLGLEERDLYLRGLVTWLGFEQASVPYERQPRAAGRTHFPLLRSFGPASALVTALASFSHVPLVLFLLLGTLGCAGSLLALGVLGLLAAAGVALPTGSALVAFGLLLWSTLVLGIGVIGVYLARVHREALGRPRYVVESTVGFDEPD